MSVTIQIPPDEDGHPVGSVRIDSFDDGTIFLEALDTSVFSGDPVKAIIALNAPQARSIIAALEAATIVGGIEDIERHERTLIDRMETFDEAELLRALRHLAHDPAAMDAVNEALDAVERGDA